MGLLDDAIREHLDLKRRRGADPAEIERAEREALGPVRREPLASDEAAPDFELGAESAPFHYEEAGHGFEDEPAGSPAANGTHEPPPLTIGQPGVSGHAADEPGYEAEYGDFDEEEFYDEYDVEPAAGPPTQVTPPPEPRAAPPHDHAPPHDPGAAAPPRDWDAAELPSAEPAPSPPAPATPPAAGASRPAEPAEDVLGETAEYDIEGTAHPPEEHAPEEHAGEEDVLEETPEFLQDTPDHDRLWFEQKPPRDFDFDG